MTVSMRQLWQQAPAELTPTLVEALGEVSPATPFFIDITPLPGCVHRRCYDNVDSYVRQEGGCREEGWIVYEGWDGRYLKLIHHCLWRRSDGVLVDVTPPDEARNLFLPDSIRNQGQQIPARYIALDPAPEVVETIEFGKHMDDQEIRFFRQFVELGRKLNLNRRGAKSAPENKSLLRSRKAGRNAPCPCGSGKKFKKCCLR
jgi:hypothetical protein